MRCEAGRRPGREAEGARHRAGRGDPRRRAGPGAPDRGFVTAETAVVLPVLVAFVAGLLWLLLAAGAQLQCVDAARAGARAAARQEPEEATIAAVKEAAPRGAHVEIRREGELVMVRVTATSPGPDPLAVQLTHEAVAFAEEMVGQRGDTGEQGEIGGMGDRGRPSSAGQYGDAGQNGGTGRNGGMGWNGGTGRDGGRDQNGGLGRNEAEGGVVMGGDASARAEDPAVHEPDGMASTTARRARADGEDGIPAGGQPPHR
ncbi:TadE family type IV pilus minor pilin [Streptomyces physcomitrii]|uniref:TadE family type IV pilus minor pilin n=1 Tax=Streptomyces physcomitrii TaxID=2724184 RepID=UPI0033E63D5E